ncbi:hypothetical protein [Pelagibius sp.]|uniref:hypothetical protein n=1 Tax=Pelagibius sp. TaxID=1931238 RepID=UPI00260A8CAD|nr:hypothetical protein [Pelagibius sp.]
MTLRRRAVLVLLLPTLALMLALIVAPATASAQMSQACAPQAEEALQAMPFSDDAVSTIRLEKMLNPAERGPQFLGVRAWVRLKSCSGFLIIDMTRSCFVRQSYTRGDCAIDGVTRY